MNATHRPGNIHSGVKTALRIALKPRIGPEGIFRPCISQNCCRPNKLASVSLPGTDSRGSKVHVTPSGRPILRPSFVSGDHEQRKGPRRRRWLGSTSAHDGICRHFRGSRTDVPAAFDAKRFVLSTPVQPRSMRRRSGLVSSSRPVLVAIDFLSRPTTPDRDQFQ